MTRHVQVPFSTFYGKPCTVDEGMLDILTLLKNAGVVTQYSCEGNMGQGYLVATRRSVRQFEKKILRLYRNKRLSNETTQIVKNFLNGNREFRIFHYFGKDYRKIQLTIRNRKKKSSYAIERSFSIDHGDRKTYRWSVKDSAQLLVALTEIIQTLN